MAAFAPSPFIVTDPESLSFPSCTLGVNYTSSILLSSTLLTSTSINITPPQVSSRTYTIAPLSFTLPVSTPVKLEVSLRINALPPSDIRKGNSPAGIKDYITLKADAYTVRIPVTMHLKRPPASPTRMDLPPVTQDAAVQDMARRLER